MSRRGIASLLIAFCGAPLLAAEDGPRTWEGTWVNRKYNTSGPLKCIAKPGTDGTWTATFSGTFQGDPFSYDVTFQAKPGRGQSDLSGTAALRNHRYEWSGVMRGNTLTGRYRSNSGYFGEFTLKESK